MTTFLNFIKDNYLSIGVIISLLGGLFKFWQYVDVKKSNQRQVEFENYHNLIERLNIPPKGNSHTFLDVQKAAVFELRHYPRYKKITKDILYEWLRRGTALNNVMLDTLSELGEPYENPKS